MDTVDNLPLGILLTVTAVALAILLFIVFIVLLNTVTSIIGRYTFYFKLKKVCFGKTLRCEKKHSLFRSFYNSYRGADLVIWHGEERVYQLKFFPYFIKLKQCTLDRDGVFEMKFRIFLHNAPSMRIPRFGKLRSNGQWYHIFSRFRYPTFSFEDYRTESVMLLPSKHTLLEYYMDGKMQSADNGVEFIDSSKFYDQKTFLKKLKEYKKLDTD